MKRFIKIGLMLCLLFALSIPTSKALHPSYWLDPSDTPITFTSKYTQYTVEITPNYWMIKNEPITWHIKLKIDILESDRVKRVLFSTKVMDTAGFGWGTGMTYIDLITCDLIDSTGYIYNSKDEAVGVMEFWQYHSPEGPGGPFYTGYVETDGSFCKGEYFYIEYNVSYNIHTEGILRPFEFEVLETWWTATGDMPKEGGGGGWYYFKYAVGNEYSSVPPTPVFYVPESPYGSILLIGAMLMGLLVFYKKN